MTALLTPVPHLTYRHWTNRNWSPDPSTVIGEPGSVRLYDVHTVTAWDHDGALRVALDGPLRKRDGGRGQHNRSLVVDLGQPQPDWLTLLVRDARARLYRKSERDLPPAATEEADRG